MKSPQSRWLRYAGIAGVACLAAVGGNLLFRQLQVTASAPTKANPANAVGTTTSGKAVGDSATESSSSTRSSSQARTTAPAPVNAQEKLNPNSAAIFPSTFAQSQAGQSNAASKKIARREPAKEMIHDKTAREALAEVGINPKADEYWVSAVNDPTLSAQEREDLIEDLNEDGISDPKHPTASDLPLILGRMDLLKKVEVQPMDAVNAAAFAEAYQDLVQLASAASGAREKIQ